MVLLIIPWRADRLMSLLETMERTKATNGNLRANKEVFLEGSGDEGRSSPEAPGRAFIFSRLGNWNGGVSRPGAGLSNRCQPFLLRTWSATIATCGKIAITTMVVR